MGRDESVSMLDANPHGHGLIPPDRHGIVTFLEIGRECVASILSGVKGLVWFSSHKESGGGWGRFRNYLSKAGQPTLPCRLASSSARSVAAKRIPDFDNHRILVCWNGSRRSGEMTNLPTLGTAEIRGIRENLREARATLRAG